MCLDCQNLKFIIYRSQVQSDIQGVTYDVTLDETEKSARVLLCKI